MQSVRTAHRAEPLRKTDAHTAVSDPASRKSGSGGRAFTRHLHWTGVMCVSVCGNWDELHREGGEADRGEREREREWPEVRWRSGGGVEGNREVPGGERDSHIILAVPQVLIAKIAVCITRRAQSSDSSSISSDYPLISTYQPRLIQQLLVYNNWYIWLISLYSNVAFMMCWNWYFDTQDALW